MYDAEYHPKIRKDLKKTGCNGFGGAAMRRLG